MIPFVANDVFLLILNEMYCIDQGNQSLIITNTMNIITVLHPSNFHVFLHGRPLPINIKLVQDYKVFYSIKVCQNNYNSTILEFLNSCIFCEIYYFY